MPQWRRMAVLAGLGGLGAVAANRHMHGDGLGHQADGGVLMDDAAGYDRMARLFAGFYRGIAADIAANVPAGARVLELGCGPGHLAIRLVRDHRLDVVGLDLDPAMVERARLGAKRLTGARPEFVVGDAAALPFDAAEFDLVVSTLSLHHWSDPASASAEIARVLRPGGRVLVWDIRPGRMPLHRHADDPARSLEHASLMPLSTVPWHWPWLFSVTQRLELKKPEAEG
jgi:ubiquinone/menaquinone biosynthesis C-methylase UbiE